MDREAFALACEKVIGRERQREGIGTLGEKTLHAVLKNYYEPYGDNQEIKVGGYVADIVGENGIIEIQTAGLSRLIPKLDVFLEYCDVTVVHPMAAVKYLSWLDPETGEISEKRRSPKRLDIYDAARELYSIRYAFDNPRFHLRLCMLEIEEIRLLNGRRCKERPKIGSQRCDRMPLSLIDEIELDSAEDYRIFIPEGISGEFSCQQFAKLARTDTNSARMIIKILMYLGFVEHIGKDNRKYIYKLVR